MNGWLNLYKPRGISSAFALAKLKKAIGSKENKIKVGHCGTLDPAASGILPVALGQATKLARFVSAMPKTYEFTIQFGSTTDTADIEGTITATTSKLPSPDDCRNICNHFIGQRQQAPHKFSAVKVNGVRAYKLARQGQCFQTTPKKINIFRLDFLDFDDSLARARFEVECSSGTYVRTLAEAIGFSLKSLGFVVSLGRIRVGDVFCKSNSVSLNHLTSCGVRQALINLEAPLKDLHQLPLSSQQAQDIRYGRKIKADLPDASDVWVSYQGRITALGNICSGVFSPKRVFNL